MFTTFADPKTDFIFKRIFGTEANKHLLAELLNALLEREGDERIRDVTYLTPEQAPPLPGMKLSVVDVKCRDQRGQIYFIEMQVLNVEAFEKRMVYNAAKACSMQLPDGEHYRNLAPVVGVTVCDFEFWPVNGHGPGVPMLSRWHMQEQESGAQSFSDIQYRFLELPKYAAGPEPVKPIDRWAYLFRNADKLEEIPPFLQEYPYRDVLEIARVANLTQEEWEIYDKAKMARQDARGAAALAHKEGHKEGLRDAVEALCQVLDIEWSDDRKAQMETMSLSELTALKKHILTHRRWP